MAETERIPGNPIQRLRPVEGKLEAEVKSFKGKLSDDVYFLLRSCISDFFRADFNESEMKAEELLGYSWEKLNTGHWKDVDIVWRKVYSTASLIKVHSICGDLDDDNAKESNSVLKKLQTALEVCDMGILMGAPILNGTLPALASTLQQTVREMGIPGKDGLKILGEKSIDESAINMPVSKKVKKTHINYPELSPGRLIPRVQCPSIATFKSEFMDAAKPAILTGVIDGWPAMTSHRWSLEYLLSMAGDRTVPVEVGSKYTEEDWTQRLMPLGEFIKTYINRTSEGDRDETRPVGYLAQHQLFNQVSELQDDIIIPDYCCIKPSVDCSVISPDGDTEPTEDIDINAWFGPAGTISPLHHDPKHNLLAQVVGEKFIRLYPWNEVAKLYPHESFLLNNTSQVDVEHPDLEKFPEFHSAAYLECLLQPGELLYIPPKCWHYIRSLSTSFSVSFWW